MRILKSRIHNAVKKHRFLAKAAAGIRLIQPKYFKEDNEFTRMIRHFVPSERLSDKKYIRHLLKDMIYSKYYYRIESKEYFMYHFEDLTDSGRRKYVGKYEITDYYRLLNRSGHPEILNDKGKTYSCFKDYYLRDILVIWDSSQKQEFLSFVKKHTICFLKPLNAYGGSGIMRLEISDDASAESTYESCTEYCPFILEEQIVQDPAMSKIYPNCVNTVRYTTFFYDGKLTRIQALLRMGRAGSIVDNATAGGIYALVDTETGVFLGNAHSFAGEEFKLHPDTGTQFLGNRVPRWEELNELLEKLVRILPDQKQIGWDFALTPKGWAVVEANSRPDIQTFDPEHGMRSIITDTFGKAINVRKY